MEDTAVMMKDAITKMQGKMKYEIRRHCAEYLEVSFDNSNQFGAKLEHFNNAGSATSSFILRSEPLRKISQALAFSTIVDPPPNQIQSHAKDITAENQNSPKVNRKRKVLQLEDSDDELDRRSSIISNQEGVKELDLNFGIEVSIDEIKRAYGVIPDDEIHVQVGSNDLCTNINQSQTKESQNITISTAIEDQQQFIGKCTPF